MIELRWLIRMVDRPRGIDDGFHMPPLPDKVEVRVLQYRTQVMQIGHGYQQTGAGDGSPIIVEYERPMGYTWTEWQDVPTVRDDSASSEHKEEK